MTKFIYYKFHTNPFYIVNSYGSNFFHSGKIIKISFIPEKELILEYS